MSGIVEVNRGKSKKYHQMNWINHCLKFEILFLVVKTFDDLFISIFDHFAL